MRIHHIAIVGICFAILTWTATGGTEAPSAMSQSQATNGWYDDAKIAFDYASRDESESARPKNIVLFVGDGMGLSTVTAARIRAGQLLGKPGEEHRLAFEEFPHTALSKVYTVDSQVPDSAGTITALMTGVKTDLGILNIAQDVQWGDCRTQAGNELQSWMMLAERAGKATGVVSTARLTHATPAGAYAHSADRNFEDRSDIEGRVDSGTVDPSCLDQEDIASQLLSFDTYGDGLEVALGGGRRHFLPRGSYGPEGDEGDRTDGRDLTKEWNARGEGWRYVDSRTTLDDLDLSGTDHLLGLFEESHMEYEIDRVAGSADEPSLAEMTEVALKQLQKDADGFALLVEAGRIDHAHHATNAERALGETIALDEAVRSALEMIDLSDTMVVVTADHGHVFTIAGYPPRGNDILGFAGEDIHGDAYTTLGYQNGASVGYAHDHNGDGTIDENDYDDVFSGDYNPGEFGRFDIADVDTTDPDFRQQVLVELGSETHSGEDVAIYASGAFSEVFDGTMEQNYVGVAIIESLGLGP